MTRKRLIRRKINQPTNQPKNVQDATQGQFFYNTAGLNSEFPFASAGALPRLKKQVCPTIYPHI